MAGLIIGVGLLLAGASAVAAGRRRASTWMARLGWLLIALAALYLLIGVMAEFGPDLTQD